VSRILNDRYRLDEIIGSGATATIWRAWDTRLDRPVAVKLLDGPGLGVDRDEARTLARLSHPGIVAIFDTGTDGGDAYLVMELVEGRSVISRLADGVFPIDEAAAVMAQVCDALAAAHAAGIVHRDIKPGNILIGPGRTVKVCDFGIARLLDTTSRTATDVAVGTSSYMSPEQVEGQPVDGRADLYAVGCVLLQMLTGDPPFTGVNAFSVAYQHIHYEPPSVRSRRPDIPEGLDRLVSRLLAKNPDDRPATAAQVRAELLAWSDPARLTAAPVHRRRPFARVGIAAVAALAVPAALMTVWPEPARIVPPIVAASPSLASPSPSPSPSLVLSPSPSLLPPSASATPPASRSPRPSPSPPTRSAVEQIADLQAFVRQLADTQQIPLKHADELTHLLDDLRHLVDAGKQREARDKLAAIQKKTDDLLEEEKISTAVHGDITLRLATLAIAISAMT